MRFQILQVYIGIQGRGCDEKERSRILEAVRFFYSVFGNVYQAKLKGTTGKAQLKVLHEENC